RWKPAALASVAGFFAANYSIATPHAIVLNAQFITELGVYLTSSGFIIYFGEAMHRARERTEGEVLERKRAHEAEVQQKNFLAVTLASIGDGVIIADAQGRGISLNAEAERLTGWKSLESGGKPLSEVLHSLNER